MESLEALDACDRRGLLQHAGEQGYLWLRGLIEPSHILALRYQVLAQIRQGVTDAIALQREILPSPEFDAIRRHPRLLDALEAVLGGPGNEQQGDVLRVVQPGAEPTPPHQDAHYTRSAKPMWSAWIPLGDCPLALGPLAVWPGSHRRGLLPHGETGILETALAAANWAASAMAQGDALLLHHQTAHRALPNQAADPRLSIDCRYVRR